MPFNPLKRIRAIPNLKIQKPVRYLQSEILMYVCRATKTAKPVLYVLTYQNKVIQIARWLNLEAELAAATRVKAKHIVGWTEETDNQFVDLWQYKSIYTALCVKYIFKKLVRMGAEWKSQPTRIA